MSLKADDGREQEAIGNYEMENEEGDDAKVAAAVAKQQRPAFTYDDADDYDNDDDDDVVVDVEGHRDHQSSIDEYERKPAARVVSSASPSKPPPIQPPIQPVVTDEKALYREQVNMARDIIARHAALSRSASLSPHSASPKRISTAAMASSTTSLSLSPLPSSQQQQQPVQQVMPGAVAVPAYVTSRESAKAMAEANGGSISSLFAGAVAVSRPAPNSTMAWGSHIVNYNNTYNNNNNNNNNIDINNNINNNHSIITAQVELSPVPAAQRILPMADYYHLAAFAPDLNGTTVVLAATTVEQATPRPIPSSSTTASTTTTAPKQERRIRYVIAALAVCLVILAAVLVGFEVSKHQRQDSSSKSSSSSLPAITQFDPFTTDCSLLTSQKHPHVVSQCICQGSVTTLPDDLVANYQSLLTSTTFYHTIVYPNTTNSITNTTNNNSTTTTTTNNNNINSCSPQNQALLWLASGDGTPTNIRPDAAFTLASRMKQRYLLALFFIIWNGPQWQVQHHGWLSLDDECGGWTGIVCSNQDDDNDNDIVTSVSLSNINFQKDSFIPTEIGLLTTLKSLYLSTTHLNGTLPAELFSHLGDTLRVLDVTGNSIYGTIPSLVGNLVHLERLMLSSNHLTGTIPPEIGNCMNIQQITVDDNYLNGTIPSVLSWMPNLKLTCFIGNDFTGTVPDKIQASYGNCANGGTNTGGAM